MRRGIVSILLVSYTMIGLGEAVPTRGARIEAGAIIEDSARRVADVIQVRKKELTASCSIMPEPKSHAHYIGEVTCMVLPDSIEELKLLERQLHKDRARMRAGDLSVGEYELLLRRAFLVASKLDYERVLQDVLAAWPTLPPQARQERLSSLQEGLSEVHGELFIHGLEQKVFMEKLAAPFEESVPEKAPESDDPAH